MWGATGRSPADTPAWQMEAATEHGEAENTIAEQWGRQEEIHVDLVSLKQFVWSLIVVDMIV